MGTLYTDPAGLDSLLPRPPGTGGWGEPAGLSRLARSQTPEEDVTTLGEEILEFYEADEQLRVEDVLPDETSANPERMAENREVPRLLYALTARLPEDQRIAFTRVVIRGYGLAEAAMVLGRSEAETEEAVRTAEESLARMLSTPARGIERAEVRVLYGRMRRVRVQVRRARRTSSESLFEETPGEKSKVPSGASGKLTRNARPRRQEEIGYGCCVAGPPAVRHHLRLPLLLRPADPRPFHPGCHHGDDLRADRG